MHSDMYFHAPLMTGLVLAKNNRTVLELGVRTIEGGEKSTSTFIFWEALKERNDSMLYSCDLNVPEKDAKQIKRLKKSGIWKFFQGDTQKLFEPIAASLKEEDRKVDILFIDTCKEYELTKFELENYSKILSDTGIILIHDIGLRTYRRPSLSFPSLANKTTKGHDRAIREFLAATDFKLRCQLGSYNMGVLYRHLEDLCGIKVNNDLLVNNNRKKINKRFRHHRRALWKQKWLPHKYEEDLK